MNPIGFGFTAHPRLPGFSGMSQAGPARKDSVHFGKKEKGPASTAEPPAGPPPPPKKRRLRKAALLAGILGAVALPFHTPIKEEVGFQLCNAGQLIHPAEHPISKIHSPQLSGPQDTAANNMLQRLQQNTSLHNTDTPEAYQVFVNDPRYNGFDVDVQFDPDRQKLVVVHDQPTGADPVFTPWVERALRLKAPQTGQPRVRHVKIDIKDSDAVGPTIQAIQEARKKHPHLWKDRVLVLNRDVPLGDNKPNSIQNLDNAAHGIFAGSGQPTGQALEDAVKKGIEDLQALRKAFPDEVLSFGGVPSNNPELTDTQLRHLETILKSVSGIKTFGLHLTIPVSASLMEMLARHDTFLSLSGATANFRACATDYFLQMPKGYEEAFWLDFPGQR